MFKRSTYYRREILHLLLFMGILFMPLHIHAILPVEYYQNSILASEIKAIAVVTDVKVINKTRRSTSKEVFFKTEKSLGDKVPKEFTGGCNSVDHEWQNPGVGGTRYIYPHKKERVLVTVSSDGGYITSYTSLASRPKLEKELQKNGLENISFGYSVEIKMDYLKESYSNACNSGDMNGCVRLGLLKFDLMHQEAYNKGKIQEVKELYGKACDGGSMQGCLELGSIYSRGKDKVKTKELYTKACNGDNMSGCYSLASMYFLGDGVKQDRRKARELFKKSCDSGNMSGCYGLGWMYDTGTAVKQDKIKSEKLFNKACDGGEYPVCFILEFRLNDKACDGGDMDKCLKLGKMYHRGSKHIKADRKKSQELYSKACEGGLMNGCYELGLVNHYKANSKEEKERAKALFFKACNGNHLDGCLILGKIYYFGTGVTLDKERAKELFMKACAGGKTGACIQLSDMLRAGCRNGVLQDCKEREILFK